MGFVSIRRRRAPQTSACWAPSSSLHLDPKGVVRACCQNTWHHLGNVATSSLEDIWNGDAAGELRSRLAADDLSLGCDRCAIEVAMGADAASYRHQFDDLAVPGARPAWPRQLELALSNSCNLQCVMCNGELSSSIRIHREGRSALPAVYDDDFFQQLDAFLPHLERITFLGGEPFLGAEPLRVMDRLIELGLRPTCHINTNGTQWGPRVQRIFRSLPLHLAVSVDGRSAATVEAIRVGVDHHQLEANLHEMRQVCHEEGSGFSLTFCLMLGNWHELADVLAWGDELDCDVYLNTVTNPPRFSLHHAPLAELTRITAALHASDPVWRARLGRNLGVWDEALDHLDHLLVSRSDHRSEAGPSSATALEALDRRDHQAPIVTMDAGSDQLITALSPDPSSVFDHDLRHLIGQPTISLLEALAPSFGRLDATTFELVDGGVELRTFRYLHRGAVRTLLATMGHHDDGETWHLALAPADLVS